MRGGRRLVAGAVLGALATGVGLFVAVWALGDGGVDDAGSEEAATTTPVIDSVDDLAAALGCAGVGGFGGVLAVEGVTDSGSCASADDTRAAGLHLAGDDEARDALLAYLEEHSGSWSGFVTCDGETPDQVTARVAFAVVAGPRWVVTTRYAEIRDAAVAAGGQEVPFSPVEEIPPPSYLIGGPPCGRPPQIATG